MRCLVLAFAIASLVPAQAVAGPVVSGEIDLFEVHLGKGDDHLLLDSTFEAGSVVLNLVAGSDVGPRIDQVTGELLYAVPIAEKFTPLVGIRHDLRKGRDLTHGVVAVAGKITPWLEAEHYLYVSEHGDVNGSAQLIASLDLIEAVVLEPRLGVGWAAQDISSEDVGSGIGAFELSVRVRHQITPALNAYTGIIHERLVGETRRIASGLGDKTRVNRVLLGFGLNF